MHHLSVYIVSRSNKQNLQSRRSTVFRIPTEPAESSTESEEEDDRVLDGKVVSLPTIRPAVAKINKWMSERASERTSKRANEQTSKRANEQTSKRANERTTERKKRNERSD